MSRLLSNRSGRLLIAAAAAFSVYFCMYGFRKPFTAASYGETELFGLGLKTVLVISQLAGYMLSKFVGVKIVAEMPARFRAISIVGLIVAAELALIGFAYVPLELKPAMLYLNGLPLGMIFGLVLSYLEGRKQTEALSAALCASFIISSGVAKSVGQWLIQEVQIPQFSMPMVAGLIFLPALFIAVWVLQATPPPDEHDREHRSERPTMTLVDRRRLLRAYWPGLSLLVLVYVALTIIRTIRDDFGVEIWRDLGVAKEPSVYARAETVVALSVTALNAIAIWIVHNMTAVRITVGLMCSGFAIICASVLLQAFDLSSPFLFMVLCGIGIYVPYVAFHTTIFERLIAMSRHPGNLGFLMYLADAMGYLGYALVLTLRTLYESPGEVLPFFRGTLVIVGVGSILALIVALAYFQKVLPRESLPDEPVESAAPSISTG